MALENADVQEVFGVGKLRGTGEMFVKSNLKKIKINKLK